MADSKISALSAITVNAATDEFVVAAGGATKKITQANVTKMMPGYEFGYDQITTASISVTSATEATGTTIISCAAHTFDGAAVIAQFFCPIIVNPGHASGNSVIISLFESTTQIGQLVQNYNPTASGHGYPASGQIRFTPTAAAHTYTVTAHRSNANGTVYAGAGGTATLPPTFIRFIKA